MARLQDLLLKPHKVDELLPSNHILVAEVEAIKPPNLTANKLELPTDEQCQAINRSVKMHKEQRIAADLPRWDDTFAVQFANGIAPSDERPTLRLIDIEPDITI